MNKEPLSDVGMRQEKSVREMEHCPLYCGILDVGSTAEGSGSRRRDWCQEKPGDKPESIHCHPTQSNPIPNPLGIWVTHYTTPCYVSESRAATTLHTALTPSRPLHQSSPSSNATPTPSTSPFPLCYPYPFHLTFSSILPLPLLPHPCLYATLTFPSHPFLYAICILLPHSFLYATLFTPTHSHHHLLYHLTPEHHPPATSLPPRPQSSPERSYNKQHPASPTPSHSPHDARLGN
ncbi:hypothetical protein Pmani_009628 [Petrolisthes manimaculis]|uniref:Uncharacterized protein n=1 Tax=Petrolisthes manimaculis TaxID=1843537 RepID=A0AAE1UCP2_9EUCA|nr:hypothetical protein Pmani_009628 [Petrolisthes manimaculis]